MKKIIFIISIVIILASAFCLSGCDDRHDGMHERDRFEDRFENEHRGEFREHRRLISDDEGEWVISDEIPPVQPGDVILEVSDIDAESENIVYTVTNLSNQALRHGDNISLYHNDDGQWRKVDLPDDLSWNRLGESLESGSQDGGEINLRALLSELPEGTYRLEKDFYDGTNRLNPTAEFRIAYQK